MKKRTVIQKILTSISRMPRASSALETVTVFDTARDHYLLVTMGFDDHRVHSCTIHLDIIDGKIWIQRDETDLVIADQLQEAGIPKDEIVLGFREREVRPYTGFAVA